MMKLHGTNSTLLLVTTALAGLFAGPLIAQVEAPTPEDLAGATGQFKAILEGRIAPTAGVVPRSEVPRDVPNPRRDARDLRGVWSPLGPQPGASTAPGNAAAAASPSDTPGPRVTTDIEVPLLCMPDVGVTAAQMRVFQSERELTLLLQDKLRVRRIWLGGEHPVNLAPSYAGHSVGHFEGDTLVVSVRGLKGPLAAEDDPKRPGQGMRVMVMATPTLEVTERWQRVDGGSALRIEQRFEDPATGMKPYTRTLRYAYDPAASFVENLCDDGVGQFVKPVPP